MIAPSPSQIASDEPFHLRTPSTSGVLTAGTAHDDMVEDADADVLQGLSDLVGCVDVLLGRVALLSGVTCTTPSRAIGWGRAARDLRPMCEANPCPLRLEKQPRCYCPVSIDISVDRE